jgi:hypothetical protein
VQLCKSLCRSEKLARSLNLQRAAGGAGFDGVGLGGFTKYGGNGGPGGFVSGSAALVAGQTLYIAVGQGGPGGWGASGIQVDGGWGGNTMPTTFGIVNGSGRGGSALAFATGGTGGGRSYILLGPEQADYLNAILVCGAGGGGGSALGIGTRASIGGAGGGLVGGVGIGNGNGVPAQGGTQVGGGAGGTYPGGNDGSPGPLTKGGDNLGSANNGGGAGGGGLFGGGGGGGGAALGGFGQSGAGGSSYSLLATGVTHVQGGGGAGGVVVQGSGLQGNPGSPGFCRIYWTP